MEVINTEYGFTFEVPDEYREIERKDYPRFHIDPTTLHIFVKFEGDTPHTISINRDDNFEDEADYLSLIELNIHNMEKMEMKVKDRMDYKGPLGRVDVVYSEFKGLKFVTYFTGIHKMMIASSMEIDRPGDPNEKELHALFSSLKEI